MIFKYNKFNDENNKICFEFNNYNLIINPNHNSITQVISNFIGICPSIFILYNNKTNKYFLLDIFNTSKKELPRPKKSLNITNSDEDNNQKLNKINEIVNSDENNYLKFYNILSIHYSNLFIEFNTDLQITSFFNNIRLSGNNFILTKLLDNNKILYELLKKINKNQFNNNLDEKEKYIYKFIKSTLDIELNNYLDNYFITNIKDNMKIHYYIKKLKETFPYEKLNINLLLILRTKNPIIIKYYIWIFINYDNINLDYFIKLNLKLFIDIVCYYDENININEMIKNISNNKQIIIDNKKNNNYSEFYCKLKNYYKNIDKEKKINSLELYNIQNVIINNILNPKYNNQIGFGKIKTISNIESSNYINLDKINNINTKDISINKYIKIFLYKDEDTIKKELNNNFFYINKNEFDKIIENICGLVNDIVKTNNKNLLNLLCNNNLFLKLCICLLINNIKDNDILFEKNLIINTSTYLFYYQFLLGGILREDQITIITKILKNYTFSNRLLDLIENTYNIDFELEKEYYNNLLLDDTSFESTVNFKREIYNLIMGSGKTKMITPILLIFFNEYIKKINNKNVILILPEKLINQSYQILRYSLSYYFGINIQISFNDIIMENITLITDSNMKNNLISENINNFSNSIVLIDEVDIIIDPISSEFIIPVFESKKYLDKDIFSKLLVILFDSLNESKSSNILFNIKCNLVKIGFTNYEKFYNYVNYISDNKNKFENFELLNQSYVNKPKFTIKQIASKYLSH